MLRSNIGKTVEIKILCRQNKIEIFAEKKRVSLYAPEYITVRNDLY